MLIICPKCSAKYQVPEGIHLENGQKLKCSACDFVFLKGEEAPLILDEPVRQAPESVQQVSESVQELPQKAFSTPLYTSSTLNTAPADSLPEAFKPVESTPKHGGLWLIPVYILITLLLCIAGWMFRDSLQPSLGTVLPTTVSRNAPRSAKHHINTEKPARIKQQPIVSVEELSQQESNVESNPPVIMTEPTPLPDKSAQPKTPSQPQNPGSSVTEKTTETPVVHKEETAPSQKPVIIPEPIPEGLPDTPDTTVSPLPDEESIPLFDMVMPPVVHEDPAQLGVNHLSFRVENDEEGIPQLLIEGELFNPADNARTIPVFTVLALDVNNQVIVSKQVHVTAEQIEARETMPFYTGIIPAPVGIDHLEVRF